MEVTHVLNVTGYIDRIPERLRRLVHRSIISGDMSEELWLQDLDESFDDSVLNSILSTMLKLHPVSTCSLTKNEIIDTHEFNYDQDCLITIFEKLFTATYISNGTVCNVNGEPISFTKDGVIDSIKHLDGVLVEGCSVDHRAFTDLQYCAIWGGDVDISLIPHSNGVIVVATYNTESG